MKASSLKIPGTFTILLGISAVVALLTFIIPAGEYQYASGTPVAGTYYRVDSNPQGLWDVCAAPVKGLHQAIDIVIFVLALGGCLGIVFKTKAIDAGFAQIAVRLKGKEHLMIPILMGICALGGSTYGMSEETIAFYPIVVPLLLAAGYDVVTAVLVIFLGAAMGVGGALVNPFNVGIASSLAGISIGDGIAHRLVMSVLYLAFGIAFVMRYAEKVRRHPEKSLVYDIKASVEDRFRADGNLVPELTTPRRNVLVVFGCMFLVVVISLIPWDSKFGIRWFTALDTFIKNLPVAGKIAGHTVPLGDWYFNELTVLFLVGGIVMGKLYAMREDEITREFIAGAQNLLGVALVLGVARGIPVIMADGKIIGTVLHFGEQALAGTHSVVFTIAIYLIYIPLAFLIPSPSGLATASIPVMAPLGDLADIPRYIIVMAFQAGAQTMSLFSPTHVVLAGTLALCNIPYLRWLKLILPFVLGFMCLTALVLAGSILAATM